MEEDHLEKFVTSGFSGLVADDAVRLIRYLERAAQENGSAALLLLAETIQEVDAMRVREDEHGGVRAGFLKKLDQLTANYITGVLVGDLEQRTAAAIEYRNQVREMLRSYDVSETYEDD